MRDLLVLPVLLFLIPMALRYPIIGVMMWGWTSFMMPNTYIYGFLSSFPFVKAFAGICIFSMLINAKKAGIRKPYLDATYGLMLAFGLHGLLSSLMTINTIVDPWIYFDRLAKVIVFCFALSMVVHERLRVHAVVAAVALGLSFHSVLEATKFIVSGGAHKVTGANTDNNHFAAITLMLMPLLAYLGRYTASKLVRWGWFSLLVAAAVAVVASMSRGGFLGLLVMGGWLVLRHPARWSIILKLVPVAFLLYAIAPDAWFERVGTIGEANEDASFMGRVKAWKMSILVASDRPFLGGGYHSIQDFFVWTKYAGDFHVLDWIPTGEPSLDRGMAAHSIYFEVLGDLGFFGLGLFLLLIWSGWRNAAKARKVCAGRSDLEWLGNLAFMTQLSLLAFVTAGAALSLAYYEVVYFVVALTSVVRRLAEESISQVEGQASTTPLRQRPMRYHRARGGMKTPEKTTQ